MAENDSSMPPPPPYAPPPYPGPGDASGQPLQYPPPGQGYSWQRPPTAYPGPPQPYAGAPPVTHPPALGGATPDKSAGYPVQPGYPGHPGYPGQPAYQPGYPAQPGYQGYPYQGYQTGPMATQTSSVTVVQGGPGVILAPQIAPPDYCGLAWFACLFCFWPTGFCAILKSNETRHAINCGDLITANQLSMETRKLAMMTIGIGISIIVVIILIRVALIGVYN